MADGTCVFWQKLNLLKYIRNPKKCQNKIGMSVVSQMHTNVQCGCMCIKDEASCLKVQQYEPRSIFTKHLISGGTDPGSVIRPLWSMKF